MARQLGSFSFLLLLGVTLSCGSAVTPPTETAERSIESPLRPRLFAADSILLVYSVGTNHADVERTLQGLLADQFPQLFPQAAPRGRAGEAAGVGVFSALTGTVSSLRIPLLRQGSDPVRARLIDVINSSRLKRKARSELDPLQFAFA